MRPWTRLLPILFLVGCSHSTPKPSCDITTPQNEQSLEFKHGFQVYHDLQLAQACSEKTGRPIFLMFGTYAMHPNAEDEWKILADEDVKNILNDQFVFTILYKDDRERLTTIDTAKKTHSGEVIRTVGQVNSELQISMFQSNALCYYQCLNSKLEPVSDYFNCLQKKDKTKLLEELKKALH